MCVCVCESVCVCVIATHSIVALGSIVKGRGSLAVGGDGA